MNTVSRDVSAGQGNREGVGRAGAWLVGAALIGWGVAGLSIDKTLLEFDATCIWVGLLALPPVTDFLRQMFPIDGRAHACGAALCVTATLAWAFVAPPQRTAAHFTALQANTIAVKSWAQLPDPDALAAAETSAESSAAKQAFLQAVAEATTKMQGGIQPASFIGERETVMSGARSLAAWRALSSQAGTIQLNAEEAAQVQAFQKLFAEQEAELGPALRQSYAVSLRDRLSSFGVTAHVIGVKADTIRFHGAALSDPAVQEKLRALLGKDMAVLGYRNIDFVADAGETHAASETADSAKL